MNNNRLNILIILIFILFTMILLRLSYIQIINKEEYVKLLDDFQKDGFVRARIDGKLYELSDDIEIDRKKKHHIDIIVDRLVIKPDIRNRLTESVETALKYASNLVSVDAGSNGERLYSQNYACPDCGFSFEELTPRMFSFNNPQGACPECT